jgi:hypothetical protein
MMDAYKAYGFGYGYGLKHMNRWNALGLGGRGVSNFYVGWLEQEIGGDVFLE